MKKQAKPVIQELTELETLKQELKEAREANQVLAQQVNEYMVKVATLSSAYEDSQMMLMNMRTVAVQKTYEIEALRKQLTPSE